MVYEESELEESMNLPAPNFWTDDDIYHDFLVYKDKKSVAKRYCISVREVSEVVKKYSHSEKNKTES